MGLFFGNRLLKWYLVNKRDLPWRHTKDPYKIWLSEVILQQTQVVQGLAYYNKFVKTFPTIKHLAIASEDKVLKMWQGLGYYSRARNLHATSKIVSTHYKGVFPKDFEKIKALKGVGNYTASAISSIAFDLPYAVVDGNVFRVLSRVFGIRTPINSTNGIKEFQQLANEVLVKKEPAIYNQAIMEFGALYCKPVKPDCPNCIFTDKCFAYNNNEVVNLPVKLNKAKIKNRYFNYFLIIDKNNKVIIKQRKEKDIWHGLYELLLIETNKKTPLRALLMCEELKEFAKKIIVEDTLKSYKHILSHQHLHANFYVLKYKGKFKKHYTTVNLKDLKKPAWPRLIDKFLHFASYI